MRNEGVAMESGRSPASQTWSGRTHVRRGSGVSGRTPAELTCTWITTEYYQGRLGNPPWHQFNQHREGGRGTKDAFWMGRFSARFGGRIRRLQCAWSLSREHHVRVNTAARLWANSTTVNCFVKLHLNSYLRCHRDDDSLSTVPWRGYTYT